MRVRELYLENLKELQKDIVTMGVLVGEALNKSIKALTEQDVSLAEAVIRDDDAINRKELDIEDKSIALIATEQPVAGDLRHVITSMKVVTQLERMGDHAVHIAKSLLRMQGQDMAVALPEIIRMAEICTQMNQEMLSAFMEDDTDRARELTDRDEEVDELHTIVQRKCFVTMREDETILQQALEFTYISRCLERFADHITNICEWIIYSRTGNHVDLNR